MKVTIRKTELQGSVRAVASKSMAHRLLICAALSGGVTDICCRELSADIIATSDCLRAMGCQLCYDEAGRYFHVESSQDMRDCSSGRKVNMDCKESGSTLRFLLPVAAALGLDARIAMHGRLPERPLSPLREELISHGAVITSEDGGTLRVCGKLRGGEFIMDAGISSQFISGLLFAMPLLREPSSLRLSGNMESESYVLMTMDALRSFKVGVEREGDILKVSGDYTSPGVLEVEGDWSAAAFWLVAKAMTKGAVDVTGLNEDSVQGDRAVRDFITMIEKGGAVIDAHDTPDLVPVLAVLAAATPGETRFVRAGRLRIKESDRLSAVTDMLTRLGADIEETADGLKVRGRERLRGGEVTSFGDHRIAMSAAIASIVSEKDVIINGAEAVEKSYPAFWEDFGGLGGEIDIEM